MTEQTIVLIIIAIANAVSTATLLTWRHIVSETTNATTLVDRVMSLERRFDQAEQAASDLADQVQGAETRLRRIFVDKDVCRERHHSGVV